MSYSDEAGGVGLVRQQAGASCSDARNRGLFQAGVSGNPGGRPKRVLGDGRSMAEVARAHNEDAVAVLVEIMENVAAPAASRVSAATHLLDQGRGKLNQGIVVDASAEKSGRKLWVHEIDLRIQSIINMAMSRNQVVDETGIQWLPDRAD